MLPLRRNGAQTGEVLTEKRVVMPYKLLLLSAFVEMRCVVGRGLWCKQQCELRTEESTGRRNGGGDGGGGGGGGGVAGGGASEEATCGHAAQRRQHLPRISRRKASSAVAAAQQHTVIQSGKGVPCCNLIAKNQLHLETERMMLQAVEWGLSAAG